VKMRWGLFVMLERRKSSWRVRSESDFLLNLLVPSWSFLSKTTSLEATGSRLAVVTCCDPHIATFPTSNFPYFLQSPKNQSLLRFASSSNILRMPQSILCSPQI
jgi:hypothetical protein